MKRYIILFYFLSSAVFGQNGLMLHLGCYKQGDTIPLEELKKITILELFDHSTDKQTANLHSWKLSIVTANNVYGSNPNLPTQLTAVMKSNLNSNAQGSPNKITFRDIKIVHFKEFDEISYSNLPDAVFYIAKNGRSCKEKASRQDIKSADKKQISYKGKLLMGKNEKVPLVNQKVILNGGKNKSDRTTFTDKYGDFTFDRVDIENSYKLEIPNSGTAITDGQIYLAKQDGSNIRPLKKSANGFVYELLSVELTKLSELKEDETELSLKNFSKSEKKELVVTKDIYYELNSTVINPDSKAVLDDMILSLKENKTLKLSIISYTDARGEDNANKILSEKRAKTVMEYLLSKGIEKERLTFTGMGETKLLNRCKNGIDCSEEEHKLNRRTEFVFSK